MSNECRDRVGMTFGVKRAGDFLRFPGPVRADGIDFKNGMCGTRAGAVESGGQKLQQFVNGVIHKSIGPFQFCKWALSRSGLVEKE